jgi:hypothetical protein
MGNTCASKPLNHDDMPPAVGSSRTLSVPPEPKPAHERWPSTDSDTEHHSPTAAATRAPAAAAEAPPAEAPPAPPASAATASSAVTGWGGALESASPPKNDDDDASWDSDGDDGVMAFDAGSSDDEVMAFDEPSPEVRQEQPQKKTTSQPVVQQLLQQQQKQQQQKHAAPEPSSPGGTSAPSGGGTRSAAVITEFAAEAKGDLALRVGEVVVLTNAPHDKQWWKGYIEGDKSRKGVFPCMFVKEIGAPRPAAVGVRPRSPPAATAASAKSQPFSPPPDRKSVV